MIVEIFTQLRNNKPRGKQTKTPMDAIVKSQEVSEEEHKCIKDKIKAIANRFKQEQQAPLRNEQKMNAIEQAVEATDPSFPDVFRKGLAAGRVTADLIMQALSIFKTKKQINLDEKYDHTYFRGILNNLIDSEYLRQLHSNLSSFYYENWKDLTKAKEEEILKALQIDPVSELLRLAKHFMEMPIPAYKANLLIKIKECFLIASKNSVDIAIELRDNISNIVIRLSTNKKRMRELILCKIHEWTNQIKLYDLSNGS